jgi:hypothetical protein
MDNIEVQLRKIVGYEGLGPGYHHLLDLDSGFKEAVESLAIEDDSKVLTDAVTVFTSNPDVAMMTVNVAKKTLFLIPYSNVSSGIDMLGLIGNIVKLSGRRPHGIYVEEGFIAIVWLRDYNAATHITWLTQN